MPFSTPDAEFHRIALGGRLFRAIVSPDGPELVCADARVALFHAAIAWFEADGVTSRAEGRALATGWYVALDGTQPRIPLLDLCHDDHERLSREFGLPMPPYRTCRPSPYASPAFDSLCRWVAANDDRVARFEASAPEWLSRARTQWECWAVAAGTSLTATS